MTREPTMAEAAAALNEGIRRLGDQIVAAFTPALRNASDAIGRLFDVIFNRPPDYEFVRRVADEHGITEADIRSWAWLPDDDWRYVEIRTWNGRRFRLDSEGPTRRVWGRG